MFNPPLFKAPSAVIVSATSDWIAVPVGAAFSAFTLSGATTTRTRLDRTTTGMTTAIANMIQAASGSSRMSFDARM
jgi:hypothetical protein